MSILYERFRERAETLRRTHPAEAALADYAGTDPAELARLEFARKAEALEMTGRIDPGDRDPSTVALAWDRYVQEGLREAERMDAEYQRIYPGSFGDDDIQEDFPDS